MSLDRYATYVYPSFWNPAGNDDRKKTVPKRPSFEDDEDRSGGVKVHRQSSILKSCCFISTFCCCVWSNWFRIDCIDINKQTTSIINFPKMRLNPRKGKGNDKKAKVCHVHHGHDDAWCSIISLRLLLLLFVGVSFFLFQCEFQIPSVATSFEVRRGAHMICSCS